MPTIAALALCSAAITFADAGPAIAAAHPAIATGFYAYASGAATAPAACPLTATAADECTLTQAIALAGAGDEILLATGSADGTYYGNFALTTAGTSASAPITIEPAHGVTNPVLNGDASATVPCPTASCHGAVLSVAAAVAADIASVTVTGGDNTRSAGGGGITDDGTLSLTGVTIADCTAELGGGVLVGDGAQLAVTNSSFVTDSSADFGGAIDNGSAINGVSGSGTLSVTDSSFIDDSSMYGGAIDNADQGTGTLTVVGSTFSRDAASVRGGAIDNGDSGTGTLTVTDSTFVNNSAPIGGAIENAYSHGTGTLTVESSTFAGDSATTEGSVIGNGVASGSGSTIILNSTIEAGSGAAAIQQASGSVQIAGSILVDGTAHDCAGTVTDDGYNLENDAAASCGFGEDKHDLVGVLPHLMRLANNGGPTETMAPASTSPVLEQIPNPADAYLGPSATPVRLCPIADQAGDPSSDEAYGCAMGSVHPSNPIPVVTSLSEVIGPAAGGSGIVIRGGNFAAGDVVKFGSASAKNVKVRSASLITATVPVFAGLDGAGAVQVTVSSASGLTSPERVGAVYNYYLPDWSAYLDGTAHSSFNPAAGSITPSTVSDLAPIWQWTAPKSPNSGNGRDFASPVVSDGVVYVGLNDGEMYAIKESTRRVLWSHFVGIEKGNTCPGGTRGVVSTATITADPVTGIKTVYVNGPNGYLYALKAATGKREWRSVVGIPSRTVDNYFAWGSPTVANGKIYIGISSNCDMPLVKAGILEFDQHTGRKRAYWDSEPPTDIGSSVWSSLAVLPNGNVIATTGNAEGANQILYSESVVELSGSGLKVLDYWQIPKADQIGDSDFGGSPTVFTADLSGVETTMVGACNKDGIYFALRADDLQAGPVWTHRMGLGSANGDAECDAAAIWNGHDLIAGGGTAVELDGHHYSGSIQELNPATGTAIWATGIHGGVVGSPSLDGGGVIAAPTWDDPSHIKGVYLLSAATGKVIGFVSEAPTRDFAQPVFDGNVMVVGSLSELPIEAFAVTKPAKSPELTVSPFDVRPGTVVTLTVKGTGFTRRANVVVSGSAVGVKSITVDSATKITVKIDVLDYAKAGRLAVYVIEPHLVSHTCNSCLTVSSG